MTDAHESRRFTKSVDILEKDDDRQRAIGAVLVPNELDHQLDFLRPEAIRRLHNPDADVGVLHSAFPNDSATTEHRILDQAETIGGETFPAGTWVAERIYHDEKLWELVRDDVLGGFSIGGRVTQQIEHGPDELPADVRVPDPVPADEGGVQIVDGSVDEVSDVDIPAVPRAEHAVKATLGKSVLDEVGGKDEFIERMAERGTEPADAERLWSYLQDVSKSGPATYPAVKALSEARTPMYEETRPGDDWDRPALGDYIAAYYERTDAGVPDEMPSEWGQLDGDARSWIAQRTLIGDPAAESLEEGVSFPVVWPNGDLSEDGLDSARKMAGRAGEAAESIRRVTARLLEDEFGHDFEDDAKMTDTDGEQDEQIKSIDDKTLGRRIKERLFGVETDTTADEGEESPEDSGAEKAGRTLNRANIRRVKATHDLAEQMLEAANEEPHSRRSRTYDADARNPFELTSIHTAEAPDEAATNDDSDADGAETKSADSENMTGETEETGEQPEWAKTLVDTVQENSEKIDEALDAASDEDEAEKDAEADSGEETPEWAKDLVDTVDELSDQVEENSERIGKLSKSSAETDQAGGEESSDEEVSEAEKFKKSLVGGLGGE